MNTTQDLPRFGYLSYAALSDVGRRRKNNEDSHGEWPEHGVFCVADGMGGARDGEVASRIVVEHLSMEVKKWDRFSPPISLDDRLALIDQTLNAASAWIFEYAETHDAKGCGTTFVGVALDPEDATKAVALHAGDSRLYRIRRKKIQLITRDHSVANMAGVKNEAELDPAFRNMILRAVGINDTVELERTSFDIAADDWIIICSDGLSKMMDDSAIAKTVREAKSEEQAVKALIDGANRLGGKDNVTVVALHAGNLPGEGAVHAPLTDDELAEMRAPASEEGDSTNEASFTIPTTVTDGGGETGQAKAGDGSFFTDDETETVEMSEAAQETAPSGQDQSQEGETETVELSAEETQDEAEAPTSEAPTAEAPTEAASEPKTTVTPTPEPPPVPKAETPTTGAPAPEPPPVPKTATKPAPAPVRATGAAVREIKKRSKPAFTKWLGILCVALVAALGAAIGITKTVQSQRDVKEKREALDIFAVNAKNSAEELGKTLKALESETADEAAEKEAAKKNDSLGKKLEESGNTAVIKGVDVAAIKEKRKDFDEMSKLLGERIDARRKAREDRRAQEETEKRIMIAKANLKDAVAELRKKENDWLGRVQEANSEDLPRIESDANGRIAEARKDAIQKAGEAGVDEETIANANRDFDGVLKSVKDAVGVRKGYLAQQAAEEEKRELKRQLAEKARKEAEAALDKAVSDLDTLAREEWIAKAAGVSSNDLAQIAKDAREHMTSEMNKALAAAKNANVGTNVLENAKKRFDAILQNVMKTVNAERGKLAQAAEKARKEAEAAAAAKAKEAEAKAKEEAKDKRIGELKEILVNPKDGPATRLKRRKAEFDKDRALMNDKRKGQLFDIVTTHGEALLEASAYPEEFGEELVEDFKWALGYVLDTVSMGGEMQKKLESWQKALEGK